MTVGYSNPCETFDSPRFTAEENFKIQYMEIWGINLDWSYYEYYEANNESFCFVLLEFPSLG